MKIRQKVFGFLDNFLWIDCKKLLLLWREYLSSANKVLTVVVYDLNLVTLVTIYKLIHSLVYSRTAPVIYF